MFKGREAVHPEVGRDLLNRFCDALSEISQAEWMEDGKGENRRSLVIVLTPKKVAKTTKSETKSDVKMESKKEEVKG
jgi:translation initiation factor IF-3